MSKLKAIVMIIFSRHWYCAFYTNESTYFFGNVDRILDAEIKEQIKENGFITDEKIAESR